MPVGIGSVEASRPGSAPRGAAPRGFHSGALWLAAAAPVAATLLLLARIAA
ncbi:hypothetical protein Q8W71_02335 [Methylobacterium sp. NEAU 140]|uniref:hypothetical protein n=1 Tax=Methylobacterium sp. NEAU 140 TaxID=3064945 RepID=UPI00273676DB|nr:hypothetical protein [Methylobacterium sp. NEAU 140]MDP4021447.1 hypothetical protein [Methylobacterium sp. NEAU 140]